MPMSKIDYTEAILELEAFLDGCAEHPDLQMEQLSGAGAVFEIENRLSHYYEKRFALTFSSATTAMQALCLAYELKGAEIVTSPFNWGGSITPFFFSKNKIRFAGFDHDSLSLCAEDLSKAVTTKTKAVVSVDYNGIPADSMAIKSYCQERRLIYISDSAQSLGAFRDGKPAGYFADAIVLSFSPGKSVYAGEGGAIVTDDETLYEDLLKVAHHPSRQKMVAGLSCSSEFTPLNGRINPLAAILLNKSFLASLTVLRKKQEKWFKELKELQNKGLVHLPAVLRHPNSITYFRTILLIEEPFSIADVYDYLQRINANITVSDPDLLPIPTNRTFLRQFKGKFSCSEHLKEQLTRFNSNRYLKLSANTFGSL